MIRETLLKILTEFETARKTGKFKGHLLASYIRNQAKQNLLLKYQLLFDDKLISIAQDRCYMLFLLFQEGARSIF
jgi:hypothetical protein